MKSTLKIIKISILFTIVLLSSCASRQNIVYFQDELVTATNDTSSYYELKYKTGDMLTIDITALDADAIRPFNLPAVSYNSTVISARGDLKMQTYLIDVNGNIDFPVLGTVKIGDLTRVHATEFMKKKLSEFIKDPLVNIRLANFTVTVLGEVNKPGTFIIQDEHISLTEALGLAGDLTIYGKRNNVFLIREVNGEKKYTKFDLTSVNVLNSPNYYLAQNDVIYVEPNNTRINQSSYNNGVVISVIGILATVAAILIK